MTKNNLEKVRSGIIFFICLIAIIIWLVIINIKKSNNQSEVPELNNSGYYLKFSDDFNKGLNYKDDLGLSIIIAIDCSGSMDEKILNGNYMNKKYIIASESLTELINFFESFYNKNLKKDNIILKVGLIKFSSNVEILFDLKEMNAINFSSLKTITNNISNFYPVGKTCIGDTMEKGAELLAQSGTIFKSLIIITDGENTSGTEPQLVLNAIVNNYNNKSTKDMTVTTNNILVSLIGFDINSSKFNNLHDEGARIITAVDKKQLNESLINLFLTDITKLEAK